VPVHLVAEDAVDTQRAVICLVADQQRLWEMYSPLLASTNLTLLQEVLAMAQRKNKGPQFDIRYLVKEMGSEKTLEQTIEALGVDAVLAALKQKKLLQKLSPEDRQKLEELFK